MILSESSLLSQSTGNWAINNLSKKIQLPFDFTNFHVKCSLELNVIHLRFYVNFYCKIQKALVLLPHWPLYTN